MTDMSAKVLSLLEKVTGTSEVRNNLDIHLFDEMLLDSLGMVELIVKVSEELQISLSPAEIERDKWSTPRGIISFLEDRSSSAST